MGLLVVLTAHPVAGQEPVPVPGVATEAPPAGMRRFRAFPRTDVGSVNVQWFPSADGRESIAVITGGINVIVDGIKNAGAIDISADRLVVWTGGGQLNLSGASLQKQETPLEFYMEGNIEFRQGDRLLHASAMYYDIRNNVGEVLDAELLTPVPEHEGKLRVQAQRLRQVAKDRFTARNAKFTTSRMGEPGYWLQAGDVEFWDQQIPQINPLTGQPLIDPRTGEPIIGHQRTITGTDNRVYIEGVPVFYWPRWTTDLESPSFYLKDIAFRNDNIFGTQVLTNWDVYELLGIGKGLPGSDWAVSADYLSDRGFGAGTTFEYDRSPWTGFSGDAKGRLDAWFLKDRGLDNLGRDRRALVPEKDFRGRLVFDHQQRFGDGFKLQAQVGLISDRNFLQQYFEREWFNRPDQLTRISLERVVENRMWNIRAGVQLNDFFTQTGWLPRADHYTMGQSLLFDRFTWFEHSNVGYAKYGAATTPTNPTDASQFARLPWEVSQDGERIATRQEIDLPFSVGPVNFVPYALGELAHWGADINGDPIQRAYGQLGLRSSLAMWTVNPCVESSLFNVHGMAHKVVFDAELSYTDASQNVTEFPLYDPITDDSFESFLHRLESAPLGGPILAQFDPRYYAIRSGIANWVASPTTEVVDDLTSLRLGVRQRWQTKRGAPGYRHLVDWMVLDTNLTIFPKEEQNFGELMGLIDYDYRWHVGDRVTLLSNGIFDTFSQGQKIVTLGASFHRPERGRLYLGVTSLNGPISTQVMNASFSYRMSPKYIATLASAVALSGNSNIRNAFSVTRIGESFLFRIGATFNQATDNVGLTVAIEPRLFQRAGRNLIQGIHIPPAGALGLE